MSTFWTIEKIITKYDKFKSKIQDDRCIFWSKGKSPQLRIVGVKEYAKVSRIILAHKLGRPIRPGYFACHTCDNPRCIRDEHLWEGTAKENSEDMVAKGRSARGEKHGTNTHPETRPRGNRHWSKTHPEKLPRGDRNGSRTHPEKLPRGDTHWSKLNPEKKATGERHGSKTHPEKIARGENQWCSFRLPVEVISSIQERYAQGGVTQYQLSQEYNISQRYVGSIINRTHWSLKDETKS